MNRTTILIALSICIAPIVVNANAKIFNHTPYPIKVLLKCVLIGQHSFEVQPGQMIKALTGFESCVIITHVQIWVKEGNMDDYATNPSLDQEVYLDRCFKQIHVITTPNEQGEYVYSITTCHE